VNVGKVSEELFSMADRLAFTNPRAADKEDILVGVGNTFVGFNPNLTL
jgi:hypothetical protein